MSFRIFLFPQAQPRPDIGWLRSWASGLAEALPGLQRLELDLVDDEALELHRTARPSLTPLPKFCAALAIWADEAPQAAPAGFGSFTFEVRDRVGYGFEDDGPGPMRGFKKHTFWKAKSGLAPEEWDALYAHHITTVPHLQPIWRYRQNIILRKPEALPFDAISENWWATKHDLAEGFFFSDAAAAAVQKETSQFIDLDVTANFVGRNELIFKA